MITEQIYNKSTAGQHDDMTALYHTQSHFTSAVAAVVSTQLSAPSSALCSDCNPPSNFVNKRMSTT